MISLLIADDNKDFDINLFNSIKKLNNKINIIGISVDGLDTYEKIKSLKPDVILLDVKMPLLNGFQVIEKLISEKISEIFSNGIMCYHDMFWDNNCICS